MNAQVKKVQKKAAAHSGADTVSLQDLQLNESQKKQVSNASFSMWIRALLQNWRQGTVACKGRSDVARSNKKPWKQKGTGRARAGSARSPLWRGGGVIFGPQPRVRTLSVSTNAKKGVLNAILFKYLENGRVAMLDWAGAGDKPQTSSAFAALKTAQLHERPVTVFMNAHDAITYASFVNIPTVKILFFDQPNAFELVTNDQWIVFKKDLDQFKEMASRWI